MIIYGKTHYTKYHVIVGGNIFTTIVNLAKKYDPKLLLNLGKSAASEAGKQIMSKLLKPTPSPAVLSATSANGVSTTSQRSTISCTYDCINSNNSTYDCINTCGWAHAASDNSNNCAYDCINTNNLI